MRARAEPSRGGEARRLTARFLASGRFPLPVHRGVFALLGLFFLGAPVAWAQSKTSPSRPSAGSSGNFSAGAVRVSVQASGLGVFSAAGSEKVASSPSVATVMFSCVFMV